jgi:hypothetical protein
MARTVQPKIEYNTTDVFAAAAHAHRVNDGYFKFGNIENKIPNRNIMIGLLTDTAQLTTEDYQQGEQIQTYFKGLTFKILSGQRLNEFMTTSLALATKEIITDSYDIAVIASLPGTYERGVKADKINRRINLANGGLIGNVGDKVKLDIEVIKQVWSTNFNVFFVTGITADDQAVFFSFRHQVTVGDKITVQGTVKCHRDNSTQLNRVKEI